VESKKEQSLDGLQFFSKSKGGGSTNPVRKIGRFSLIISILPVLVCISVAYSLSEPCDDTSPLWKLKPIDSVGRIKVGDKAPDFILPTVSGEKISLSQYLGKKNVVLSFEPAAWTPLCSDQWPGYNIIKNTFDRYDSMLLGITVDNLPTLRAWTDQMGKLWFPVLSDFWPHGAVAEKYGVLRSDGVSERALFVIDKIGIVRYIHVHDINKRPPLEDLVNEFEKLTN
jgi:peroxiredoxin (alkyl hydroperoxide reductase subunit C)